jgi:hypothetical protein
MQNYVEVVGNGLNVSSFLILQHYFKQNSCEKHYVIFVRWRVNIMIYNNKKLTSETILQILGQLEYKIDRILMFRLQHTESNIKTIILS